MDNPKKDYYAPMHSAEHILNRTMVNMFNCERAINCHIERKKSKCDFILSSEPKPKQIQQIEDKVNEIIQQNLEIRHSYIDYETALTQFKLKIKKKDNPKIRITSIGNYDDCPCIGEHVSNTSEIGIFKISTTSFENNILRIRFKLVR